MYVIAKVELDCFYTIEINMYDLQQEWNHELLKEAGLNSDFLPSVVDSGEEAGKLVNTWYGIPASTPVTASLGRLVLLGLMSLTDILNRNIN